MRMFALPAAFLLAFCLYLPLPRAEQAVFAALERGYRRFCIRFGETNRSLGGFLLALCAAASLLGAVHPVAAAVVMTPLFTAPTALRKSAAMKHELDSGKYMRDIPAYENHVRETCRALAPAFISGAVAPMLVCAVGMPLYIGCGLGWVYAALRLLHPGSMAAQRALVVTLRAADKTLSFLMQLSAGAVGRNPFRTKGRDAKDRLMSILGIAGNKTDTHAPMAGDISQGVFLCCFCCALLLLTVTLIGLALC